MPVHKFLPNSDDRIANIMLRKLGISEISDLFSDIPKSIRLSRPLRLSKPLSEIELEARIRSKLSLNKASPDFLNFVGGGSWLHHVPSIIDEILSRGEYYTSYTPYQPEISQGILQALFEYQSQMCELTGMEVANSSLYDWGTALGEAARMSFRVTKRRKILVGRNTSPERIGVLRTYTSPLEMGVDYLNFDSSGRILSDDLKSKLSNDVAALYVENPNFLGIMEEEIDRLVDESHSKGALAIVGVNPLTLGVLKPPGAYGADIVVGDGQPLGLYPNFGGPQMGIFATREDSNLLRQMPGRLIGATTSKDGSRRGYTMVLQTREQHIRREHATSNICTNEALLAVAVCIYLSCMGPAGMREIGKNIVTKSHYALKRFHEEGLKSPYFTGPFFGEVSLETKKASGYITRRLVDFKILGGLPLERYYNEFSKVSLFSFSELHDVSSIEQLVSALKKIESEN